MTDPVVNAGELTIVEIDGDELLGLITVDGPEITIAKVGTTTIGAGGAKTSRPSNKHEVGPLNVQFIFDGTDTVHTGLVTKAKAKTIFEYTESYEDGSTISGDVFISSFSPSGSEDESNVVIDMVLEHTSDMTYTAPSGGGGGGGGGGAFRATSPVQAQSEPQSIDGTETVRPEVV